MNRTRKNVATQGRRTAQRRQVRRPRSCGAEQLERHHRLPLPPLTTRKCRSSAKPATSGTAPADFPSRSVAARSARTPAPRGRARTTPRRASRRVRAIRCPRLRPAQQPQRDRDRDEVDREHPAPRRELDQSAAAERADHRRDARPRGPRADRCGTLVVSNVSMISASVLGTSSAPATPCTARAAISTPLSARPRIAASETPKPPYRSRTPGGGRTGRRAIRRRAAATRASAGRPRRPTADRRARREGARIAGSATLTTVPSRNTIPEPRIVAIRTMRFAVHTPA